MNEWVCGGDATPSVLGCDGRRVLQRQKINKVIIIKHSHKSLLCGVKQLTFRPWCYNFVIKRSNRNDNIFCCLKFMRRRLCLCICVGKRNESEKKSLLRKFIIVYIIRKVTIPLNLIEMLTVCLTSLQREVGSNSRSEPKTNLIRSKNLEQACRRHLFCLVRPVQFKGVKKGYGKVEWSQLNVLYTCLEPSICIKLPFS